MPNERLVYISGELIPESQAKISIFDYAVKSGYMVQEWTRTLNHKLYKLDEHLKRLYMSLKVAGIDPGMSMTEMERITHEVLESNISTVQADDDVWMVQEVSPGLAPGYGLKFTRENHGPTVLIFCIPLVYTDPLDYSDGVHVVITNTRNLPPECCDPKIKHNSRLFMMQAVREAKMVDPKAWALMLDLYGNVTEIAEGANFFIVKDGVVRTSSSRDVLQGVARKTALEIARELSIPAVEEDFQSYDVYTADEAFLTKTSQFLLPVTRVNKLPIGDGKPGPITKALLKKYIENVGVDVVKQASKFHSQRPMTFLGEIRG